VLTVTKEGLYCAAGDFHIDPWKPVPRAVITHAHSDHARAGSQAYLCASSGASILQLRVGVEASIRPLDYGETIQLGAVKVSLHPAGHVLGSAQIRLEHRGEVWVVSGDYKTHADPTCTPFEPVRCHTFVTESTFGLPVFNWPAQTTVFGEINAWWRENRGRGRTSLLFVYALGKAQRVLAGVDTAIGPIFTHGAVEAVNNCYRNQGVKLPATRPIAPADGTPEFEGALVMAPPSAAGSPWMRRFSQASRAFVSGWMNIRGQRRRRAVDRGFVLSDHGDWTELNRTIRRTTAETIWVTHGYTAELARWLRGEGLDAREWPERLADDSVAP
jgi:putative mRNA 3-end processing factor